MKIYIVGKDLLNEMAAREGLTKRGVLWRSCVSSKLVEPVLEMVHALLLTRSRLAVRCPGLRREHSLDRIIVPGPAASRAGSIAIRKEHGMSSTIFSHNITALGEEQESGISHGEPHLLPLIEYTAGETQANSCLFEAVSQLTQLAAQRLPITAASPLCCTSQADGERPFADQVFTTVSTCLHEGFRRLLLVPWGGRQEMGPLVEPALLALSTVIGEAVSQMELALPHVHVEDVSARSGLGGLSSAQTQLGPLLEAFPGWDRSWVRLSAGKVSILLLRSGKGTEQASKAAVAWRGSAVKALAAALCPQQAGPMTASERSRWQRDGEIYTCYLVSLLSAATDFLRQEQKS